MFSQDTTVLDVSGELTTLTRSDVILVMAAQLQPLPGALTRLATLVDSADCSLETIAEVIRMDPALTLKLLRTANSAYSGSVVKVATVEDAVMRLGMGLVISTVFSFSVGGLMSTQLPAYDLAAGQLWRHCAAASVAAECLVRMAPNTIPPSTITAALLHDVGKLVVAQSATTEEMAFVRLARQEAGLSLEEAEMEILEMNHAEIGFIIAQHWGLPERICRAIMYHHDPVQWDDRMCDALHIANLAADVVDLGGNGELLKVRPAQEVIERLQLRNFEFVQFCTRCLKRFNELRALYGA